jgi:hypothetical protein
VHLVGFTVGTTVIVYDCAPVKRILEGSTFNGSSSTFSSFAFMLCAVYPEDRMKRLNTHTYALAKIQDHYR